jgi:hypothetical protein
MKPIVILGAAIVSGILVFFISEEAKKTNSDLKLKKEVEDEKELKALPVDHDLQVRELRKALRTAERKRKAHRDQLLTIFTKG